MEGKIVQYDGIAGDGQKCPYKAFCPLRGIKSRGAVKNAVQRIYLKTGNTKRAKMYAVDGQTKTPIPIYTRDGILYNIHNFRDGICAMLQNERKRRKNLDNKNEGVYNP